MMQLIIVIFYCIVNSHFDKIRNYIVIYEVYERSLDAI